MVFFKPIIEPQYRGFKLDNVKQELGRIREEVLYRRHPEELFDIRNRIIMDALGDAKEKLSIEVPEGMKGITESAVHIVNRVNALFEELKEAIEKKNEKLEQRIKDHIVKILDLVTRTCGYQMEDKEIIEKAKIINICILTNKAISEKAPSFAFEYVMQ